MFKLISAAFVSLGLAGLSAAQEGFEDYLDAMCASEQFSGAALIRRDDASEIAFACTPEWIPAADRGGPDDPFYIASVTKAFTAVLVLQQVDAGRLSLDDTIGAWLPGLSPDIGGQVTVRHLLSHTSGLMRDHTEALPSGADINDIDAAVAAIDAVGLLSDPGARYNYSNSGYRLLAHILEAATGQSYAMLLQAGILEPAGLHDTSAGAETSRLVSGYELPDLVTRQPVENPIGLTGAGQMFSTVHDLDRFAAALRNGSLLSPESQAFMLTGIEAEGADGTETPGWLVLPLGDEYRAVIATGAADGYLSILLWIDGGSDAGAVFLQNSSAPGREASRNLLLTTLRLPILELDVSPEPPATPLLDFVRRLQAGDISAAVTAARGLDYSETFIANAAARQATGAPDGGVGETQLAWAPATANAGAEWLEAGFRSAPLASVIDIHFTQIPETFTGLEIRTATGVAPGYVIEEAVSEAGAPIVRARLHEAVPVESVRIALDTHVPGWPQIDAVGIHHGDQPVVWADSAQASTSAYASRSFSMHELPSRETLILLADRLDANNHGLLAAQIRQTLPLIHPDGG